MIKIVIPTNGDKGLDDQVAQHFGRCNTYTFLDNKGKVIETINNTSQHTGGLGLPPELMKKHGANILLCRDLGPSALDLCKKLDIEVYVGEVEMVSDIFRMWKNNKLKKAGAEDACQQHK